MTHAPEVAPRVDRENLIGGSKPRAGRHPGVLSAIAILTMACSEAPDRSASPGAAPGGDGFSYVPEGSAVELGLAGFAKVMCSAVFVSGRDPGESARTSGYFMMPRDALGAVSGPQVDRAAGQVSMTHGDSITRTAKFMGDQGCVLLPEGRDAPFYEPVRVTSSLPPADSVPWPMGDVLADAPLPEGVDSLALAEAVDLAFSDPEAHTAAFAAVHRGRLIAERYAPGIDRNTQLESWSMGKSLTATLVGILIQQGAVALDDPAPVPAWREDPDDPRARIRIADLLRMSSGLRFIAPRDPDYGPDSGYPDHMYVYTGAIDVFDFSIHRPLQFEPNTEGRYRNSDPLVLGYLVRETVRAQGEEYLTFPQRVLFDLIGIRRQVLETDPHGNFLLTGYDYGTARNWARLGMLYLWDGVWQGRRILPEGFVDFVSSPAPAWSEPIYGGLFWLNGDGAWSLPRSAYFMAGGGGQRTFIVPSHDLVVVRLGHFAGAERGMTSLDDALARLMQAIPAKR